MKFIYCLVIITIVSCIGKISYATENETNKPLKFGLQVGYSQFTGFTGIEIQRKNYAVAFGLPESIGFKYYPNEEGRRWFLGINAMRFSIEDDETVHGTLYTHTKYSNRGIGLGYKWRFKKHWEITLELNAEYRERELSNSYTTRNEKQAGLMPGLSFGFTF